MKNISVQEIRASILYHLRLIRKHYFGAKKAVQEGRMYYLSTADVNAISAYGRCCFGYYMCDFVSMSTHWRTRDMIKYLDLSTFHEISFEI